MNKINKRTQTLVEISLLLPLVVAALIGIQVYLKRALQGRYKSVVDSAVKTTYVYAKEDDSQSPPAGPGLHSHKFAPWQKKPLLQYEPYYNKEETKVYEVKEAYGENFSKEASKRKVYIQKHSRQISEVSSEEGIDFDADNVWEK